MEVPPQAKSADRVSPHNSSACEPATPDLHCRQEEGQTKDSSSDLEKPGPPTVANNHPPPLAPFRHHHQSFQHHTLPDFQKPVPAVPDNRSRGWCKWPLRQSCVWPAATGLPP